MTSKAPPPSTGSPAGVPPSGNGKYVAVAVVLLGLIGFAIYWKISQKPPEVVTMQLDAGPPPPPPKNTHDDDIPLPAPVEDAGQDAGKKPVQTGTYSPSMCDSKVCTGASTSELESTLAGRAQQSRRRCYEQALLSDPTLKGKIAISVRVGANGSVCSAGVASSDPGLAVVANCVASYFRGSSMPAPKGGCADIAVPINFVPR